MEPQKIINLLNDSSYEESKFARKKWQIIDSQTAKGKYDQNDSIKFEMKSIKSLWLFWCIYFSYWRYNSKCKRWYICCLKIVHGN